MLHRGDRRPIPFWNRGTLAAVVLCLALPTAHAQDKDSKPEDQYKYTPEKPQSQQTPNYQYRYQPDQQYQPNPQYQPPKSPPAPQYPQYQPPKYPQYPQYPQYPAAKGPPGQYRGSPQDQQACINDVFRLCNQFIPDAPRIISCLQSNRKNLSPPCRAVFSRGRRGR